MNDPKRPAADHDPTVPDAPATGAVEIPRDALYTGEVERAGTLRLAGRYEILGLVGVGGMGAVYRARDTELDETIALKMLRRELMDDPTTQARFRQEVKLARRVTHKNVARTFDIGEHEGERFLTMELIDGVSLGAMLAEEGAPSIARAVEIATAISEGLSAAHAAGVIHRDLKPHNVLLSRDGRVVVTDFGVACLAMDRGGDSTVKTQGAPVGTPAYMAPEQVLGAPDLDARVDIYALGTILYELFTGERAWLANSVYSVAAARLVSPAPDPRAKRPDLPEEAAAIVLRCMATKREDRFPTASDVAAALAKVPFSDAQGILPSTKRSVLDAETGGKTVAVLPFRNAGGEDYVADGLTDDLIDALSMTRGLRVRSRGAVARWSAVDKDPREIGRALGVQVVVEGSVRRAQERIRVNARVVSVEDGFQLWAKRFDRPAEDVLLIGDETAKAIADALTCGTSPPPREAPTDPVAIDLYLRARHEYHKAVAKPVDTAIELFKRALALAPNDAMILSGYAMAETRRFANDITATDAIDLGRDAAQRALAVSPHLGEARIALAYYFLSTGDPVAAAREISRALESSPSLAEAHDLYGRLVVEVGPIEEGIARLNAALTLEPHLWLSRWELARSHALLGDWAKSDAMLEHEPEDPGVAFAYWLTLARLTMWRRDARRARALMAVLKDRPALDAARLILSVPAEEPAVDALRVLEERATAAPKALRRRAFFRQLKAEVLACLGDEAGAAEAIADAEAAALVDVQWLERCPLLAPMQTAPWMARVREKVAARARLVREAFQEPRGDR